MNDDKSRMIKLLEMLVLKSEEDKKEIICYEDWRNKLINSKTRIEMILKLGVIQKDLFMRSYEKALNQGCEKENEDEFVAKNMVELIDCALDVLKKTGLAKLSTTKTNRIKGLVENNDYKELFLPKNMEIIINIKSILRLSFKEIKQNESYSDLTEKEKTDIIKEYSVYDAIIINYLNYAEKELNSQVEKIIVFKPKEQKEPKEKIKLPKADNAPLKPVISERAMNLAKTLNLIPSDTEFTSLVENTLAGQSPEMLRQVLILVREEQDEIRSWAALETDEEILEDLAVEILTIHIKTEIIQKMLSSKKTIGFNTRIFEKSN